MNSLYGNHNSYDGKQKSAKKTSYPGSNERFRIAVTAAIVNLVTSSIMIVLSFLVVSSGDSREIYTKLLFLPVSAFIGAFVSFLLHKELVVNASVSAAVHLIMHLIFVNFSFWSLLWALFYFVNAMVGFMSGLIVRTFH